MYLRVSLPRKRQNQDLNQDHLPPWWNLLTTSHPAEGSGPGPGHPRMLPALCRMVLIGLMDTDSLPVASLTPRILL